MTVPPRIVIAAGGTAGHVVPAIAVADALRAEGAQVTFVGGQRAEAELVPQAGYELDPISVEGISRTQPAEGRPRGRQGGRRARRRAQDPQAPRRGRRPRRRRVRRRAGRARRHAGEDPARAHRGRLAPRADQPPARQARRAGLPGVPARGLRRRPLPRDRPPGAGAVRRPRPCPRPARHRGGRDAPCSIFGGSLGARSINHAAVEAFKDAPYRVIHVAGTRDFPDLHEPRRRTTSCSTTSRRSAWRWPPPTPPSPAPAARSSSSPSTASPPC